jgi:hypothetical protein
VESVFHASRKKPSRLKLKAARAAIGQRLSILGDSLLGAAFGLAHRFKILVPQAAFSERVNIPVMARVSAVTFEDGLDLFDGNRLNPPCSPRLF